MLDAVCRQHVWHTWRGNNMASKKSGGNAGAGSVLGTMSGAAEISPSAGKDSVPADLLKKVSGTATLAARLPVNDNKAGEFAGKRSNPAVAAAGVTARSPSIQVTGSTVSETVVS